MMISEKDYNRFLMLRKRLFKQIEKQLEEDGHCKSYEGLFTISIEFNDYFKQEDNKSEINCWTISLDLYLIAPNGRHHLWTGKTFKEALDACEKDINTWINFHNKYLKGEDVDFDSIEQIGMSK